MLTDRVLFTIFIIYLFASIDCGKCPPKEVTNPCNCENDLISCQLNQTINLKNLFEKISQNLESKEDKHFTKLTLEGSAFTELEDNTFQDITFDSIRFTDTKLKKISPKVFSPYNIETIEKFEVYDHSIPGGYQYEDFFPAMTSLINTKYIDLFDTELETIPENAFNSNKGLRNLFWLQFIGGSKMGVGIHSIENNAFYYLKNLVKLNLRINQIDHLSKHAFDFYDESEFELYIDLHDNKLNDTSIEIGAFLNAKRPLSIDFSLNQFTYLDERIFAPILLVNGRNKINVNENPFECDCRMYWLFKERDSYQSQMLEDFNCKNGKKFWSMSSSDFNICIA